MGMTPSQYWYGDPFDCVYYYKAWKLREKEEDRKLWMQGAYIYEAFCASHPIFNPFAKPGTKPLPYAEKPYTTREEEREQDKERAIEAERLRTRIYFDSLVRQAKERRKEAENAGNNAGQTYNRD